MTSLVRDIIVRVAFPAAGFLATAITFGPGRMGFGLFLPAFRESFQLDTATAGVIATMAFSGFLLALPIAGLLLSRFGPRLPVLVGGLAAATGFVLVSIAGSVATLAAGVMLATSSAGFAWTPYNNAAERLVDQSHRTRTLSIISTGTTVGVAVAGALALVVAITGLGWRFAWGAFAVGALIMTAVNLAALRPVAGHSGPIPAAASGWRSMMRAETVPLATAAISYGATSAVYLSFAVDLATSSGALAFGSLDSAAPMIFIGFGIAGLVGVATGEIENRIGLVSLVRVVFVAAAASHAALALAPGQGSAIMLSAVLQGIVVMMTSAILSFWSVRLFPQIPSVSFTAVLIGVALGSILGPVAAGWGGRRIRSGELVLVGCGDLSRDPAGHEFALDRSRVEPPVAIGMAQWDELCGARGSRSKPGPMARLRFVSPPRRLTLMSSP
ncbi:MFS transporter [Thalassobaculum sp. OXR-137]|uniref:MFS transporter n=1 Tax=Thalassobaculum sp. OXR-137 TaxID=3100173 RepID=UPI002AC896AD|nr:MFS transporter [Thalassobaculum sp. OXR-137]WPZ34556.1 MFS transporter [Thalassobaculum sp. OXR-137]